MPKLAQVIFYIELHELCTHSKLLMDNTCHPLFLERSVTANCRLSVVDYYKSHALKNLETHSYYQTFALYRHKVSNPTIKRFYSFDETFPFLYGKHSVQKGTCIVTTQNHL